MLVALKGLIRQLRPALLVLVIMTALTGVIYPLAVTGVAQAAFKDKANGSLIHKDSKIVGSSLIGQTFADAKYFHSRPSAAGAGYDGTASSGSNLGPTNPALLDAVKQRVATYRTENGLSADVPVPADAVTADAVTASGSGLDPQISIANARLQAARVAKTRGITVTVVDKAIHANTTARPLGVLGDPGVNVLLLNLSLDRLATP